MNPAEAARRPKSRKALIYLGVASAMLLLYVLSRRSKGAAAAAGDITGQTLPVQNPAVDPSSYYSGGTGAGGVDYGPQLATIDTDLQTLSQAIQAGQTGAQTPGPTTPAQGGLQVGDLTSLLTAFGASAQAGVATFQAGMQSRPQNLAVTVKQAGPGNQKAKPPQPKLTRGARTAPFGHNKPPAPKGFHSVGLGGGYWEFAPGK